ncbi:MAG TPA: phosphate acyltransferase PlsX [Armatimonadota bacterium]|nr:phosphate acyltransferase PlsX [Armatimonadota bacterium]
MRIAVDAMGGDFAPVEIVKGAVEAAEKDGIDIVLVGDRDQIKAELAKHPAAAVEIMHASEIVQMDEHPANAIRRKPDSSIVVAAGMVVSGEADAIVSAGNTGAAMAVATLKLGRIPGIARPAIASFLPTNKGKAVLLDGGANVDCSVDNLLQFAVMGREYAERVLKLNNPRIGLLSIGEEPSKGNELTKAAHAQLAQSDLHFVGNIDGKDVFRGAADVIICDGFAGNLVLKIAEAIAEFLQSNLKEEINKNPVYKLGVLILSPALKRAKNRLDYAEYGGAPLLGVNGVCIISHGRSDARAIRNAIKAAASAVENNVVKFISTTVQQDEFAILNRDPSAK